MSSSDIPNMPASGELPDPIRRTKLVVESVGAASVARVVGEVDLSVVADFKDAIEEAARAGGPTVIDLTACTFIDSTCLSAVVDAEKAHHGHLWIMLGETGIVRRVFTMTALLTHLPVISALAELQA
jgi:anti-anti-sigma factor